MGEIADKMREIGENAEFPNHSKKTQEERSMVRRRRRVGTVHGRLGGR